MKAKRFWRIALVTILGIAVLVCGVKVLAEAIYDNHIKQDDTAILERYEAKKEKCDLLRAIPNDFIEEGKGINLKEIPDNIRYKIKNKNDGNIEFHYYIEQEVSSDSNPYTARITLSKDYKIINEVYGIELEDFETFKQGQERIDWVAAYLISIGSIGIGTMAILLMVSIIFFIEYYIKKKKSRS